MAGKNLTAEIGRQEIGQYFAVVSWYSIMAGMGIFPDRKDLRSADLGQRSGNMERIDDMIERSLLNFRDHREVLMDIPPRKANSIQTYFWASK